MHECQLNEKNSHLPFQKVFDSLKVIFQYIKDTRYSITFFFLLTRYWLQNMCLTKKKLN
jgi:hypothetical protein